MTTSTEDLNWIISREATALIEKVTCSEKVINHWVKMLRRDFSIERVRLLLNQVELRQRGLGKFPLAAKMYFSITGLEQASDSWIAAYKATQFTKGGSMADICCGIGGDLLGLATRGPVTGVDLSEESLFFAKQNSQRTLSPECFARVTTSRVDATLPELLDLKEYDSWHADPDRRVEGRRSTRVDFHQPNSEALNNMLQINPHAGIKLAPVAELPEPWEEETVREWISRERQCRQLVVWHGKYATNPGERRATIVHARLAENSTENPTGNPTENPTGQVATQETSFTKTKNDAFGLTTLIGPTFRAETYSGEEEEIENVTNEVGNYLYEPDPGVLAARLTGSLVNRFGLASLGFGSVYLCGESYLSHPHLTGFEVLETLPMKMKQLIAYFRDHNIGRLEIKKRGVDTDPAKLRKMLKLQGTEEATLFVTRVGVKTIAIITRRLS